MSVVSRAVMSARSAIRGLATERQDDLLTPVAAQANSRPNFLVVVTDDMRDSDWQALPQIRELVGDKGTTFPNFFLTTPVCSPSRATLFTGMYAHHHGVKKNDGKDGGYRQFKQRDLGEESIASVLRAAGYRTGIFGKFMNGAAEKGGIAGGWDQWMVAADRNYYKPVMNDNGKTREYQKKNQYSTDILTGRARDFLNKTSSGTPFLLWFTPRAPHGKLQPRRKDRGRYGGTWRERSPDVLEEDASDKPIDIRQRKTMSLGTMDKIERKRLDLLAATDDAVAAILAELKADGRLAHTVVFVLSDNGYMLGSHRCEAKGFPYRAATQVTMLASGPPFAAGVTDERVTGNIDIAPTIAALAGVSLPAADGVPIFDRTKNSAMLVENFGSSGRAYAGLRTTDYLYVENGSGERELYDYRDDPYELDNLLADWNGQTPSADAKATAANLRALLQPLLDCTGATCR